MKDYCEHCRRRTEHIKDEEDKLCKRCGRQSKRQSMFKGWEQLTKFNVWRTP